MWKQWRIEGGMEKGEENADDEEETTLSKVDEKSEFKGKDRLKDKDDKGKKKETRTCNHCGMKGHIEVNLSPYCPESFDGIVKNKLPGKLFFFRPIRSSSVSYVRALYTGASQYIANRSDSSWFVVGF
jgi:hypothetical protein